MTQASRADQIGEPEALLLRAAIGMDAAATRRAWAEFRARVPAGQEPPPLCRLLPMVGRNLARLGAEPDAVLSGAYANTYAVNARTLLAVAEALGALRAAGVPTLVLKGTALLVAHYRDLGARAMSDADVLVPSARIAEALDVLERCGWRGDPARAWLRRGMHAGTVSALSGLASIDLHRHATYEARCDAADRAFFADSQEVEVAGAPTRAMAAGDQLLHVLVHGVRWSVAPSAIWVADVVTLLRGGQVDVERTVARARQLRLVHAATRGLEAAGRVGGPEPALEALLARLRRHRAGLLERLEHWYRVRPPAGAMGALPNLWFAYRRGERGRGFPAFLAEAWDLPGPASLPRALLAKAARRLGVRDSD